MGGHVDAVEQPPRLVGGQYRRLAAPLAMRRPAPRSGRVRRHGMTRHQPVEQVAHAGEQIGRASWSERVCEYRVDLGGRRNITKKNYRNTKTTSIKPSAHDI